MISYDASDGYQTFMNKLVFPDALAFGSAHFGVGSGDILLDNVRCTGSESSLLDCTYSTSVYCSLRHNEDAGVRCHGELILIL